MAEVIQRVRAGVMGRAEINSFKVDINKQTLEDIRAWGLEIATEETDQQVRLGNNPTRVITDNKEMRSIEKWTRKIEIVFGVELAANAMDVLEDYLFATIDRMVYAQPEGDYRRTGALGDRSNWQWFYRPANGKARPISSSESLPAFGSGDAVWIKPVNVAYASVLNNVIASSGRFAYKQMGQAVRDTGQRGRLRTTKMFVSGFFGFVSRAVRNRKEFRLFDVRAYYGAPVRGEESELRGTVGTWGLVIMARRSRQREAIRGSI